MISTYMYVMYVCILVIDCMLVTIVVVYGNSSDNHLSPYHLISCSYLGDFVRALILDPAPPSVVSLSFGASERAVAPNPAKYIGKKEAEALKLACNARCYVHMCMYLRSMYVCVCL